MKPYLRRSRKFDFRRPRPFPALILISGASIVLLLLITLILLFSSQGKNSREAAVNTGITLRPDPFLSPSSSPSSASSLPTYQEREWPLLLVNASHPLPEDYSLSLSSIGESGEQFDSRAVDALESMLDAMQNEGLSPLICSAYRSRQLQQELFDNKISRLLQEGYSQEGAEAEAALWVNPPGVSEHETGLAADIVSADYQVLEEEQENTPEQRWLLEHCTEYGFILRYPKDKVSLTNIGYEPWHYRYVGVEAAREIAGQGLCLEEYLGALPES